MSSKRAVCSEFYSETLRLLSAHSWFSGLTCFLSAPVTLLSVNAYSRDANANDLLNVAFFVTDQ